MFYCDLLLEKLPFIELVYRGTSTMEKCLFRVGHTHTERKKDENETTSILPSIHLSSVLYILAGLHLTIAYLLRVLWNINNSFINDGWSTMLFSYSNVGSTFFQKNRGCCCCCLSTFLRAESYANEGLLISSFLLKKLKSYNRYAWEMQCLD